MSEQRSDNRTILDQMVSQDQIQVMKAALPYVPPSGQRFLSVMAKMMELQNIMNFYDHSNFSVNACSAGAGQPDMLDILADIRNYCEGEEQAFLDQWIQIISAMELYSVFAQAPEGSAAEPQISE